MKDTADQSAELVQALRKELETPELAAEAERFPLEANQALEQVEEGHDFAIPGSWVANRL